MRSRRVVTSIHVIASVGLLGSTAAMLLTAVSAARSSDPAFAHAAYTLMQAEAFAFGIPLSIVSLASGIALGRGTRWGVLRYWWTAAKLVLLVVTVGVQAGRAGASGAGPQLSGAERVFARVSHATKGL
jgi:uncharacterized membrane protein